MSTQATAETKHVNWTRSVDTDAAEDTGLASRKEAEAARKKWNDVIDNQLVEWGKAPHLLAALDEGFEPPSAWAINEACRTARDLRDIGCLAPLAVVVNGSGGICFEWRGEELSVTLKIQDEVSEVLMFRDCRLVEHQIR